MPLYYSVNSMNYSAQPVIIWIIQELYKTRTTLYQSCLHSIHKKQVRYKECLSYVIEVYSRNRHTSSIDGINLEFNFLPFHHNMVRITYNVPQK